MRRAYLPRLSRAALLLPAVAVLCGPAPAPAQQPPAPVSPAAAGRPAAERHAIRMNLRVGNSWAFDQRTDMNMTINATAGGQVVQRVEQKGAQRRAGTVRVLAAADGTPTAIAVTFADDCRNTATLNGGDQTEQAFGLAGKTVTLRAAANGAVTHDAPDGTDPAAVEEAKGMLKVNTGVLPPRPVAVGDEWRPDPAEMARQFQLAPTDRVTIDCKLAAVGGVGGRRTGDIGLTGTINKIEGPARVTIALTGVARVDLLTGQALQTDITGEMTATGGQEAPGPDGRPMRVDLAGNGRLESHQTAKPADAAPVAVAPVAPVPVAPAPEPAPVPAPTGGAKGFAGTFKGDGLTVELAPAGGATGGLTGTITLGDRKFPATGAAADGKLAGRFESEGAEHEFTAAADGNTLTLTTGGTTYRLKRAAVNPLARPPAANPLDTGK